MNRRTHLQYFLFKFNKLIGYLLIVISIGCSNNTQSSKQPYPVLLISFDGFRHDYLSKTKTPHFDSLAAEGVQSKGLIPVFPSKTFPNHYSIATGLYPENSGLIANSIYDEDMDEWYRISDRAAVEDHRWYHGEPIWNTVEKQGLTAGTLFWVGSEADIQHIHPTHWKKYDSSMPFRARIDTVIKWLSYSESNRVDFATLYFEHVDKMGHWYGTDSDSLKQAIQQSDQLVGYLRKQLEEQRLWGEVNVIIVSDHGMVDLAANKIIELDKLINLDNLERIVWAPVTMMEPKPGKKQELYESLKQKEDHYRIYKKENLPERYHLKGSSRVPELIMVADPGFTILNNSNKDRFLQSLPAATHGYDPRDRRMHALFMAAGPAFKKNKKIPLLQNVHIYELMTYLLNLKPATNDGSLDSVRVMLAE